MANTKDVYTGNGATDTFSVTFPYISTNHVSVEVDGEELPPTELSWPSASSVKLKFAPADGASVVVKRTTPVGSRLVDFQNGAVLTEEQLDLSASQLFYLIQEVKENYDDLINNELIRIGSGNGIVSTDPSDIIAGLVEQILNDSTAQDLNNALSDIADNAQTILQQSGLLDDEVQNRLDGDASLQAQIGILQQATAGSVFVQPDEPVPGVGGVPDPIPDNARWYDQDDDYHPYVWDGAAWQSLEDPRIGQNAADITALDVRLTTAEGDISANGSALSVLDTTVTNLDGTVTSISSDLTELESRVTDAESDLVAAADARQQLQTEVTSNEQATTANAQALTALEADLVNGTGDVWAGGGALSVLDVRVTDNENGISTVASDITALTTDLENGTGDVFAAGSALAAMQTSITSNENGVTNVASDVSALEVRMTDAEGDINTVSVEQVSQAQAISDAEGNITSLEARYGVRLDVNGYVSGFVQNNDGETSDFIISADKFAIVDPAQGAGQTGTQVFQVDGNGNVTMQGDLLAAGTVAASALQSDMVISNLIRTASSPGVRLEIEGGGATYPLWYGSGAKNAGNATFYVKGDGSAYFGGTLEADIVDTTNIASGAVTIETDNQSSNSVSGSAPYHESQDHNSTGGQVQVVAICYSAYSGSTVSGTLTATLQRSINDGSWTTIDSASLTLLNDETFTRYFADPSGGGGVLMTVSHDDLGVSETANGNVRFEYIDTVPNDGDKVEYRVRLSGASATSYSNFNWISTKEWKR